MLVPKNYILSSEMASKANIAVANFSMFLKNIEDRNIKDTVLKYGVATFINTKSDYLPKNFYKIIYDYEFTDMEDVGVVSYLSKYFEASKQEILNLDIVKETFTVGNKQLVRFKKSFADSIKNKVVTNINYKDYVECEFNEDIEGAVKISKNNYIVWY